MKKYFIFSIFMPGLLLAFFTVAHAQTNTAYSAEAAPPSHAIIVDTPATQALERAQQSSDKNPSSTQTYPELNLPRPELPVINLETTTQETGITTQTQPANIDTGEIANSIIGPVMFNQLKIVLVVFLGAVSGAILALLILFLIKVIGRRSK